MHQPVETDDHKEEIKRDLDRRFNYHQPGESKCITMAMMRAECRGLAWDIVCNSPAGREQAIALTKLEEVMFWFNAAVARP